LFRSFYREGVEPEELLASFSLEEKTNARVGKLSGGQKQRLAVACSLVGNPDLLFLDEPTTGLDPQSRRQIWDLVETFRACGHTVLLTTHFMDEAERLCDRVAIVDHGKVIALGTPRELIASLGGEHVVELEFDAPPGAPPHPVHLEDLPSVSSVSLEPGRARLSVREPHVVLPALLRRIDELGVQLTSLTTRHASLEDVFVKLAGRHLSEEEATAA
ncbi:MAG: ATP-binding cassette domain-containing protein, partial [Pirellulales bacterium]